jgi:catechol 2,3-dioxygenase-like lactoylglutathione lyase family enzyme
MMRRMKSVLPSKVSIIVLGVNSVAKSVAFYRDTLGLQVNTQSEDLAFVLLSGLTFMLSAELGKAFKPIAGATEIVFPVDSVNVTYRLLSQCGCNFIRHPRQVTADSWAAMFTDPDEHKLTIFGPH